MYPAGKLAVLRQLLLFFCVYLFYCIVILISIFQVIEKYYYLHMMRNMGKRSLRHMRTLKVQTKVDIRAV